MGDFSTEYTITSIEEILPGIDSTLNFIDLSNNNIRDAHLEILPESIKTVYLKYNNFEEIHWDDRVWELINIEKNNLDLNEFRELICGTFRMGYNCIKNIEFEECVIGELSISNNNLKLIKFINCQIKKLDLSNNNVKCIDSFPNSIEWLCLSNNCINSIKNLPLTLTYLDLSINDFNTFDLSILPPELKHFDITGNNIIDSSNIFKDCEIEKLFYDSEASESATATSETSSDLSIELNYIRPKKITDELLNNNKESIFDDMFCNSDDETSMKNNKNTSEETDSLYDELFGNTETKRDYNHYWKNNYNKRISSFNFDDDDDNKQNKIYSRINYDEYMKKINLPIYVPPAYSKKTSVNMRWEYDW